MSWEPNVGKWYDDNNYDIKKPLWKKLLDLSIQYGDTRRLKEILVWFDRKNMHGDYYKIFLISCFLHTAGVDLEEYIDTMLLSDIVNLAEKGNTMDACAINLLKREDVPEEYLEEFRTQFTEKK